MKTIPPRLLPVGLFLCLTLAVAGEPPARAAAAPPNLVFILVDDLGYGDIGPFGSASNRTPNLDRMAKEGLRLTSFYAAPVCTPSRAQVLTGCYAKRVSLPHVLGPRSAVGIGDGEHTIAELLKARGYATMCIGKWHVGDHPDFLPTRHGFDHYLGIPYSNDMGGRRGGSPPLPLVRDTTVIEVLDDAGQDRVTERYTDEAVRFIRGKKDGPFFLYFPHTAVHVPIHPGAAFRGGSANGRFGDWVEEVDWSVGRVLDTLRELGLADRTLVLFSSDNGPWLVKGTDGGVAGPLRGGKGGTFEGGVRVPTLAWWPGRVPAGTSCAAVAGNIDVLPTFVALAGGAVPTDHPIDGRDISPLLFGTSRESPREAHYLFSGAALQAVRSGPWKLAIARQSEGKGQPVPGRVPSPEDPVLYNLDEDLGERSDVAAGHPDVVRRMRELIARMDADLGVAGPGPGVREPGRVQKNPGMWLPGAEPAEPAPSKPVDVAGLKPGDTLPAEKAPQVGQRAFTLSCEVDPKGGNGPLVAHGGASVGYALYLAGGKPAFTVRQKAKTVTIAAAEAPTGIFRVEARLAKDGAMTLRVDGTVAASGKAPGPIPNQPVEDFCVGCDTKIAVADYGTAARFRGEIRNLSVTAE